MTDTGEYARSWTKLAVRWAAQRWCWDDAEECIAQRARMTEERPDDFIDAMAEKYGLDDPTTGWGIYDNAPSRTRIALLREAITESFPQLAAPAAAAAPETADGGDDHD